VATPDHDPDLDPDLDPVGSGLSSRQVRLAAGIGGVVLFVVVVIALATVSHGGDKPKAVQPEPPPAPAPSSNSAPAAVPPPSPSASPSSAAPAPSASTPPAAPVQRWKGTLTVNGPYVRRDLDATPPRTSTHSGEPDVRGDWLRPMLKGESDAQLAVLSPGSHPDAKACRDAASSTGESDTDPLQEGDVVCVVTASGRVARLITEHSTQTTSSPELTFSVVVWDMPAGGQ
jgi:hypothetical protein